MTTAAAFPSFRRSFTASSHRSLWFSRLVDSAAAHYRVGISNREAGMTEVTVSAAIDGKIADRAMLKHPFYQAWTEGRLSLDTLRAYARQYFHHVEAFPQAVSAVHTSCPDRDGRRMLADNLAVAVGIEAGKQDHAALWLM